MTKHRTQVIKVKFTFISEKYRKTYKVAMIRQRQREKAGKSIKFYIRHCEEMYVQTDANNMEIYFHIYFTRIDAVTVDV